MLIVHSVRPARLPQVHWTGCGTSPEKWGIRRTLAAAQVSSRTIVEAFRLVQCQFFSSHLCFFGPFLV